MLGSDQRLRRTLLVGLLLVASPLALGCRKKAPTDRHLEQGYLLLQSDPKAALAELEQVKNPLDPRALLGRALALEKLRSYAEAEKLLVQACAAKADPTCWLALARVRVVLGRLEPARQAIDQLPAGDQTELLGALLAAYLAHDEGRARTALAHLQKWSEHARSQKPPQTIPAEFYLAEVALFGQLRMKAEFEAAKEQAKKAKISQARGGALGLVELAVKSGRPALAVELLRKIEEEHPSSDVRRQVAKLAHGLGDHRLSGDILDTLPGSDAELVTLRAEHDFATGKPQASASLRQALELAKDKATESKLRLMLAEATLRSGQRDEARSQLDAILAVDPTRARAARLRVALEVESQKPTEAVRVAQELVRRAPKDAQLRLLFADAIREAKGPSAEADALAVLEKAHLELPSEGAVTAALAADLAKSGHPERAASLYQELLQRAERDPVALNNLAMIYADELHDPAQAVALAERAYALSTKPPLVDTLGWALYRRRGPGDLERARQLLESVREALGSPTARYHLGAVLLASGAGEEGRLLVSQALAQSSDFQGADQARSLLKAHDSSSAR